MNKVALNLLRKCVSYRILQTPYCAIGRNYSFKSDLSLETIYTSSNLRLYTATPPQPLAEDKFNGFIPLDKLDITYSRSGGPGGQNVNTTNTKVDVRFYLESASWLSDVTRKRLAELHKGRITKDGYIVIKSELTRSQQMNMADVLEKLRTFIREAEKPQSAELSPETVEKLRRRHEKATRERLAIKRNRSQTKADRRSPVM
ncbi:large ribosomal subunit protein mL62 [Topomyia yanbarensis]|uniref:large ribosomal subunit protein mL62 n=1 Tax=Topomyia yanbarensis TaxID=2498891 RepID=UPI00273A7540|nr:large ribosomal subunit protein mL62 [Topomyia yanbarensis]XP_058824553.1 large ribosomal subunit protein mL62 [Topomyia yanbarensis]